MYNEGDLKDLAAHLKEQAAERMKLEPPDEEGYNELVTVARQLEVIRFNPLVFQKILRDYDVEYDLLSRPLKEVPLHIHDAGLLSNVLVRWRCTKGI
jgi:hypothetical protein